MGSNPTKLPKLGYSITVNMSDSDSDDCGSNPCVPTNGNKTEDGGIGIRKSIKITHSVDECCQQIFFIIFDGNFVM